jgi:hypothetical protein
MNPLKTIDAETLLATPLQPVHFLVDRLLPPGLHLLAGAPKIGKSWLMMQLCLKVATGIPLFEFQTLQSDVLYLCLEDTLHRIQSRLFRVTDTAPENLHFAIMADSLDNGLKEEIGGFLARHPQTRLIIIDTLQRVRGIHADGNAYANDYKDISLLKELADQNSIAIILVHHLRKMGDSDPFQRVSGTTGLTGAVDTMFVLEKAPDGARLHVRGRDVEHMELGLRFRDCQWEMTSLDTAQEIQARETPRFLFLLVDFMASRKEWRGTATELLALMEVTDTPANLATKWINQYSGTFLAEQHISYTTARTNTARLIKLKRDDGDGHDDDPTTAKRPSPSSPPSRAGP